MTSSFQSNYRRSIELMTKIKQDVPLDLAAHQPSDNHWYGFCILHVYPELPFYSFCHQTAAKIKNSFKPKIFTTILGVTKIFQKIETISDIISDRSIIII